MVENEKKRNPNLKIARTRREGEGASDCFYRPPELGVGNAELYFFK